MPLNTTKFGQVITSYDIEQAVISQLKTWMPATLAEVERQAGLAPQTIPQPPDPENSFAASLDFDYWQPAYAPMLVTVVQPVGEPEREYGNGTYLQEFEIQIASIVQADDENVSRQQAQWYGAAVMLAILQHGSLGKFPQTGNQVALKTVLASYPTLAFKEGDSPLGRRAAQSVVTVHSLIDSVVAETGPLTPPNLPYAPPGGWPQVATTNTTINAQPLGS